MDRFPVGGQTKAVTDDVILSVNGGILTTHGKRHTAHGIRKSRGRIVIVNQFYAREKYPFSPMTLASLGQGLRFTQTSAFS
jgi:hypothetical protein